jgi:hypothetical protein
MIGRHVRVAPVCDMCPTHSRHRVTVLDCQDEITDQLYSCDACVQPFIGWRERRVKIALIDPRGAEA